jgi:serine/threonine protein kinase
METASPVSSTLRPGDLLEGRYELEVPLGAGGTARVFRALDRTTKATVAVKVMDPELEGTDTVAYFTQEARLAARIRDPHLIAALHFGEDAGRRFIVFDYMVGAVPLRVLAERGRLAPRRVCVVALQVLYGLQALHRAGVVHGDVSLNNCLWREHEGPRDEVLLIDLGRAWIRPPCPAVSGGPTSPPEGQGTPGYTAPEILLEADADHRADLWSVGAIMYALLTAREVDLGECESEELLDVPPPRALLRSIPKAVDAVVKRSLLAPPSERYPSAAAMIAELQAVLAQLDAAPRQRAVPVWLSISGGVLAGALGVLVTRAGLGAAPVAEPPSSLAAPSRANLPATRSTPPPAEPEPAPSTPGIAPATTTPVQTPPIDGTTPTPTSTTPTEPAQSTPPGITPATTTLVQTPPLDGASSTPTPTSTTPTGTTPPEGASTKRAKPRLTWAVVKRKASRPATTRALRACTSESYISLGLRVEDGRATLESIDDVPLALPRDRCAAAVVAGLRFARGEPLVGVVGVQLPEPGSIAVAKG